MMTGEPIVDIHAHLIDGSVLERVSAGREGIDGVTVVHDDSGFRVSFRDGPFTRPMAARLLDIDERISWMDRRGIDVQVVSGWLDIYGYELPGEIGARWAQLLNDGLIELVEGNSRFAMLATVPLQAPQIAAEMLRKEVARGFAGAMIATRVGAEELDHPAFGPFFQAAHDCGAVVYVHPGFCDSERYSAYGLVNALGRLEDTSVTVARLLYADIPRRFPRMKLVLAHGGGSLPYVLGRLDRNVVVSNLSVDLESNYRHLYFDSIVFDSDSLGLLCSRSGATRLMLGSDYPFPIGDLDPRALINAWGGSEKDKDQILGKTACKVFGIPAGIDAREAR